MKKKCALVLTMGLFLGMAAFGQDAGQTRTTETTKVKVKKKKHNKETSTTTTTTTKPQ